METWRSAFFGSSGGDCFHDAATRSTFPATRRKTSLSVGLAGLLFVLLGAAPPLVAPTPAAAQDWKTGPALREALDEPLVASWSGSPLRSTLTNLARQRRVCIWLDRRADPGRLVEYAARDVPLRTALTRIGEPFHLGVSVVGPVAYLGPVRAVERLATLAAVKRAEVQRTPSARARKLLAPRACSWPERSEPRELVRQLLDEAELDAKNLDEAVPHDLWPAGDWPAAAWADRMTLVLAGFGLTYELSTDGRTIVFRPWPDEIEYEHAYSTRSEPSGLIEQLQTRYPKSRFRSATGKVIVAGRYEDHEEIERLLRGEKLVRTTKSGESRKSYTLTVERQPIGPAARAIAEKIGMQVEFDEALESRLSEPLTFKVEDASVEALWKAVAKAARMSVRIEGDRVRFEPPGE